MKLLTLARDLQRRKARQRQGRFVAEGVRAVEALLSSPVTVTGVLVTTALRADARGAALFDRLLAREIPVQDVTDTELATAADTDAPQGILAIGEIPAHALNTPSPGARYLVLDALQDPGNVGTLIRTAAALGVTATIALPGTVDLWNAKVVRSTMGALFTHPALHATWETVTSFLDAHRIPFWLADTDGDALHRVAADSVPARLALAVGNEGAGVSDAVAARADRRIAIAMTPGIESLNVAVATGILLHALRPRPEP